MKIFIYVLFFGLALLPSIVFADASTVFYEAPVVAGDPGVIGSTAGVADSGSVIIGGALGNGENNTEIGFAAGSVNPGSGNTSIGNNAGGNGSGNDNSSLGFGAGGSSNGDSNVSIGELSGRLVTGNNNTSVGEFAGFRVTGNDNISIGRNANNNITNDNAIAIGTGANSSGLGGISLGQFSSSQGFESMALGNFSFTPANNSVALGSGSIADRDNTISVGSVGAERQITNVADGTDDFDAVNVRQLSAAIATVGGGFGTPGPSFDDFDRLENRVNRLDSKIDSIARKAYAGVAIALASSVPVVTHRGGRSAIVGLGTYGAQSAIAGGMSYMTHTDKLISVSAGAASTGDVGVKAGMSWAF